MKKLIIRSFFIDTLKFFLISALSISIIVWVVQAVNYLDFVSEDGHSFLVYFKFTLLNFPKIFSKLIIFVYFVSLFFVISKYEANNEILILWSHGVRKIQFINTILFLSTLVILLQLLLSIFVVPKSQDHARSYLRNSQIDFFPQLIKQKQFVDPVKDLTIFIQDKNRNGELKDIFIKDQITGIESQIIYSRNGKIVKKLNDYYLILYDGKMINIDEDDSSILSFSKSEFNLSKYQSKTTTFPKIQEINTAELFLCIFSYNKKKIGYRKDNFSCSNDSINAVYQEIAERFIKPFFIMVVTLVSLMIILKSKTNHDYNKYRIILFIAGVVVVIISEIFNHYIIFNNNFNFLFLSIPFLLFLSFYFYLFVKSKFRINTL